MHFATDLLILVISKIVGEIMEIKCINCKYFRLHELHDDIGICTNKDSPYYMRMVMTEWQCPFFMEFNEEKDEDEFYWCSDCKTMIHKSLLPLHKGHKLVKIPYIDEESHLETYVAD
jgi:hypothetical protein